MFNLVEIIILLEKYLISDLINIFVEYFKFKNIKFDNDKFGDLKENMSEIYFFKEDFMEDGPDEYFELKCYRDSIGKFKNDQYFYIHTESFYPTLNNYIFQNMMTSKNFNILFSNIGDKQLKIKFLKFQKLQLF